MNKELYYSCNDILLWRAITKHRNKSRLKINLEKPQRPSRENLVNNGVFKGITKRNIQQGEYTGNLFTVYEQAKSLNWKIISESVHRGLKTRPNMDILTYVIKIGLILVLEMF